VRDHVDIWLDFLGMLSQHRFDHHLQFGLCRKSSSRQGPTAEEIFNRHPMMVAVVTIAQKAAGLNERQQRSAKEGATPRRRLRNEVEQSRQRQCASVRCA
jgi:hypothetical protein